MSYIGNFFRHYKNIELEIEPNNVDKYLVNPLKINNEESLYDKNSPENIKQNEGYCIVNSFCVKFEKNKQKEKDDLYGGTNNINKSNAIKFIKNIKTKDSELKIVKNLTTDNVLDINHMIRSKLMKECSSLNEKQKQLFELNFIINNSNDTLEILDAKQAKLILKKDIKKIKNNKDLNEYNKLGIKPGLRTLGLFVPILGLILVHEQFSDIREYSGDGGLYNTYPSGWVFFGWLMLGFLGAISFLVAIPYFGFIFILLQMPQRLARGTTETETRD